MIRGVASLALISLALGAIAEIDEGYTKKIREYTTAPFFLTDLIDSLPASKTVPTPEKFLGYAIGTPNMLTYASKGAEYLRALEKTSKRIKVMTIGKSEEGRELVVALISDEANLKNLERLREVNHLLADPRDHLVEAEQPPIGPHLRMKDHL